MIDRLDKLLREVKQGKAINAPLIFGNFLITINGNQKMQGTTSIK